jgi:fatty acid desaturase
MFFLRARMARCAAACPRLKIGAMSAPPSSASLPRAPDAQPPRGEEFRDDLRARARDRTAPNPRKALTADDLARLTALDPWRSTLAIAGTFLAIAAIVAAAVVHWTWWTAAIAVVLIAPLQHALFILAHDAAHYRLFQTRWLNDAVGRIAGGMAGISMCTYRVVHRLHHNHLYGDEDPDIALHGGYPRGRWYLVKKLFADVTGQTAWKTYAYFFGAPAINAATGASQRPLDDTSEALRASARRDRWTVLAFHTVAPIVAFAAGHGWQYLVLWVLPAVTILQAILRLRAIAEHGAVTDFSSPLTAARTNVVGPLARFVLFPHHVNHHLEHHLFPAVPHYRLPELHRLLASRGVIAGAEVVPLRVTLDRIFAEPSLAAPPLPPLRSN